MPRQACGERLQRKWTYNPPAATSVRAAIMLRFQVDLWSGLCWLLPAVPYRPRRPYSWHVQLGLTAPSQQRSRPSLHPQIPLWCEQHPFLAGVVADPKHSWSTMMVGSTASSATGSRNEAPGWKPAKKTATAITLSDLRINSPRATYLRPLNGVSSLLGHLAQLR
jgi:hypothetical protein